MSMIYTLPFIAALTGWITNYIAVKMLFHPRKPVKILFFKIQGIFPKRQKKLAEKLGKVVASELISLDDIKDKLNTPEQTQQVTAILESRIDYFLTEKVKESFPMLAMFLNEDLRNKIKTLLSEEISGALPQVIDSTTTRLEKSFDVETIVKQKVEAFSTDKFEEILLSIMKKEFKFIELLGGVLGFIIGLIQILLLKVNI